jgi:hypothetical protein
VSTDTEASTRDRLRSPRTSLLGWWVPHAAIVAGLLAPVPIRATIWTIALVWMGVARILNAGWCARTHCRYTGPYYLAMIAPVFLLAAGIGSAGFSGWLILGALILAGSKIIWWATECLGRILIVGHPSHVERRSLERKRECRNCSPQFHPLGRYRSRKVC